MLLVTEFVKKFVQIIWQRARSQLDSQACQTFFSHPPVCPFGCLFGHCVPLQGGRDVFFPLFLFFCVLPPEFALYLTWNNCHGLVRSVLLILKVD